MLRRALFTLTAVASLGLAGCDLLGIEGAAVVAERKAAEGKAVGAACRHAGRAIEDCYLLNRKAEKAAIYAGWREMDDYMRENKLEPVAPEIQAEAKAKPAEKDAADAEENDTKAPAKAAKDTKEARASSRKAEAD
jgi:hypothetical protein